MRGFLDYAKDVTVQDARLKEMGGKGPDIVTSRPRLDNRRFLCGW
jgi:hypothetical protein